MKQFVWMALVGFLMVGCNDTANNAEVKKADSATVATPSAESYDYPYTPQQPYRDWQPGDQKHAVMAMKALKAYETGDIVTCVGFFGDTVDLRFDYYQARLSNDSLKKSFTDSRSKLSAIKITMQDWESVISKDKTTEYVTMWYKEVSTDKKGKADSVAVIDDAKIVNGKIVELDQKIQHYPTGKKM